MGILSRLRNAGEAFVARRLQGEAVALSIEIPRRGRPLWQMRLEAQSAPHADGRQLRLRAHWRLNLRREINSWVELRASNAALDEGSRALVPERLETLGVGIRDDAPVQNWAGATPGPRPGFAMLTLLQLDKRRLPERLRRALGPRPLQLSAALVNVIEET